MPTLLWLVAAAIGFGGGWLILALAEYEGRFFPDYLIVAVPFGLFLGGAVITTLQATGRRVSVLGVLLGSLAAAALVHGLLGFAGSGQAEQAAGEACTAEEVAALESLSFSDDWTQPPTGTRFGSCYVLYTVEGTGQQARVDMQQLLLDNGWRHTCEPYCPDDVAYHYFAFYKDGFVLVVNEEGAHDLPGDALQQTDDGATTMALDVTTSPCTQQDVETLQEIYEGLYDVSGYVGEPGPAVDLLGTTGPDAVCQTGLGFDTRTAAEQALLQTMTDGGWALTMQDEIGYTFDRLGITVEATISEQEMSDPEESPIAVTVALTQTDTQAIEQ